MLYHEYLSPVTVLYSLSYYCLSDIALPLTVLSRDRLNLYTSVDIPTYLSTMKIRNELFLSCQFENRPQPTTFFLLCVHHDLQTSSCSYSGFVLSWYGAPRLETANLHSSLAQESCSYVSMWTINFFGANWLTLWLRTASVSMPPSSILRLLSRFI